MCNWSSIVCSLSCLTLPDLLRADVMHRDRIKDLDRRTFRKLVSVLVVLALRDHDDFQCG